MVQRRAPFIAVETDLTKDERPAVIADIGGYNVYEARGRLITLWSWCADRRLKDAPVDCDGYAVPEAVVRRFLGADGVRGILGDGCDELALGERRPDGLIYLRGTSYTVASFRALRAWAAAGGRARVEAVSRNGHGQFVSSTTNVQQSSQPYTSYEPAATSVDPDPRSQISDPRSQTGDRIAPPARKSSRASRTARSLPMPADWAPQSEEIALAKTLGVDASRELAAFRDHHSAKGTRFVDWNAAFRTWLRNSVKFSRSSGRAPSPSFFDVLDSLPTQHRS